MQLHISLILLASVGFPRITEAFSPGFLAPSYQSWFLARRRSSCEPSRKFQPYDYTRLVSTKMVPQASSELDAPLKTLNWSTDQKKLAAIEAAFYAAPVVLVCGAVRLLGLDWRPFVAGGLSAGIAHAIATPMNVIKTRMQTNPELYSGSVAAAFRRIVRAEGQGFLWKGIGPTAVGYFLEGALKYGVYEAVKRCARLDPLLVFLLAGVASGVAGSVVLCPVEDARIRMVAQPEYALVESCEGEVASEEECSTEELDGLQTSLKLYREEGLRAAYSGFPVMLFKQIPYTVAKNCVFDGLTALLYAALPAPALGASVRLLAALPTAALACVASQPGDVLVTAHYKNSAHSASLRGLVDAEGLRGLFVGTKARILHVGFIITLQLVMYDFLRISLGMAASGR